MEITIVEDRPNPLLKRHEYRFEVAHATAATPSRDAVRSELSKLVHAPKDRVVIERMAARYGTAVTQGDAMVYETSDGAKSITREHILVRNGLKEKAASGGTPAAKAEEAPVAAKPEATAPTPPAPESPAAVAEAKPEVKSETKHPGKHDAKPEGKHESKADAKHEAKADHKDEAKGESHKGEHKPRAPKGEKADKPEKSEAAEGGT